MRKYSRRTTGSPVRRSISTKSTAVTAARAKRSSIHHVEKPTFSPSITAKVSAETAITPAARPPDVQLPALRVGALGERPRRGGERREAEHEVEPEDAAPAAGVRDEKAAEDRPGRERDAGHRRPDAESARPRAGVGIDLTDQRQRPRLASRGSDAHHDAAGDQGVRGVRQGPDERARAEEHDPAEHHLLAAEKIAERAADQHQPGEREHVAVDDPLEAGHAAQQRLLHVGQRDADDRVVEERQEQDCTEGRQRESCRARGARRCQLR